MSNIFREAVMSDTRLELKNKMKEDAKRAWQTIKDVFNRYSKYGVVALGLAAGSAMSSDDASKYAESLKSGNQKLENKLKIREVKAQTQSLSPLKPAANIQSNIKWEDALLQTSWLKDDISSKVEEIYASNLGDNMTGNISVQDLFSKVGVTKADIQSVIDKNPEMLKHMSGGEINRKLARAANHIENETKGKCTQGVQMIFAKAGMGDLVSGSNPNWPEKERGAGNSNSGCNVHIVLEKGGEFTTVHVANQAYTRRINKDEAQEKNQQMNEFIRDLPPGTPISIDNRVDEFQGRRLPQDNQGIIHGHTGVINNRHNMACDFEQVNGVNFSRYGQNVNISIAKDMELSRDFAKACIKAKLEREQRVAQNGQQQKKMAYLGR